jgi:hypothetical protein
MNNKYGGDERFKLRNETDILNKIHTHMLFDHALKKKDSVAILMLHDTFINNSSKYGLSFTQGGLYKDWDNIF